MFLVAMLMLCVVEAGVGAPKATDFTVYADHGPIRWRISGASEWHEVPALKTVLPVLDAQHQSYKYDFEVDSHTVGWFQVARGHINGVLADQFTGEGMKIPTEVHWDVLRLGIAAAAVFLAAGIVIGMLIIRSKRLGSDLAQTSLHLTDMQAKGGLFPTDGSLPPRVDKYEVLQKLGAGGMAVVYRVRLKGDEYALKLPLPHLLEQADFRARFVRELKLGMALQHPNLVHIYDVNDGTGSFRYPYLVMEYVQGEPLETRIQRGTLDFPTAVKLGVQILDALASIHGRGIIHRDLKPSNVMLTRGGNAKVMDFGIAYREETRGGRLTETGDIIGTPLYLAPEQISGAPADPRLDIYGVGMILYEGLAGGLPWSGGTSTTVMMEKVSNDTPPLGDYRRDIPRSLEDVIMRMVERRPQNRYETAAEARDALRGALPKRGR